MPEHSTTTGSRRVRRRPSRAVIIAQALTPFAALATVVLTPGLAHWRLGQLAIIAVFAIASDLTAVQTASKLKMSGSFLGIVLAAVLLGGGPAALIGVLTIAVGWLRWREAPHYFVNNLADYAWFPLLAGLFFHAAIAGPAPRDPRARLLPARVRDVPPGADAEFRFRRRLPVLS